jgi:hypothetical protein
MDRLPWYAVTPPIFAKKKQKRGQAHRRFRGIGGAAIWPGSSMRDLLLARHQKA